ncbi:MAG: hypothetical protein QGG40_09635, partial [Myxococcota bacterium]|nr:hypothetical protein [Myxococcota bacterium]
LFGESDTVSHHFWRFHDPDSPRHPRGCSSVLRDTIATVYERLDLALERLVEASAPEWICLCSDHGFGGSGVHVLHLNRFLEDAGWLGYQGGRGRRPLSWVEPARRWAVGHLPHSWPGRVFRRLPRRSAGRLESAARFGGVDFGSTRAISDEMNYAATIRLNLPPESSRHCAVAELSERLTSWEVDGQRPVRRVWTREQLYHGPCVERSPELVLELNLREGYTYTLLPSARVPPGTTWRALSAEDHGGGKGIGMNGSHRQHGLLWLWGPGVKPGVELKAGVRPPHGCAEGANVEDVAPTLLHLLGVSPVPWMDGRVLVEGLHPAEQDSPGLDRAFVTTMPGSEADGPGWPVGGERSLRDRLSSLGYLP